ncbi:MAG: 2Fe-2S iron-sulfur cluster-binding protein, partial [Dehalococcoidia bacterium]|nr:2Fe-2S iron-sulfur cluster-binding protein [Dehalococcoidia bacterium]
WCGVCNFVVNGKVVLGCRKSAEKTMVIEPHPKFKLIKDLVVDFDTKVKKRKELPKKPSRFVLKDELCDGCGDCVLICPTGATGLRKKGSKVLALHTDAPACCGVTCKLCADNCHTMAITILD